MRAAVLLSAFLTVAFPAFAQLDGASTSPSVDAARKSARWAEVEADRRIADGDYEGAVQAQAQADADKRAAKRLETFARGNQPQRK